MAAVAAVVALDARLWCELARLWKEGRWNFLNGDAILCTLVESSVRFSALLLLLLVAVVVGLAVFRSKSGARLMDVACCCNEGADCVGGGVGKLFRLEGFSWRLADVGDLTTLPGWENNWCHPFFFLVNDVFIDRLGRCWPLSSFSCCCIVCIFAVW